MFNHTLRIIALSVSLLSTAVLANDTADSSKADDFGQQLATKLDELQVPGAQVVLFDDQQLLWQRSFGYSDAAKTQAVTADTLFRAGSTSKTVIAMAIMQLVNQGKFSLQDDVLQLEPALQLTNPWQSSTPVRVIHLLEHTAGLDDMHFRNFYNVTEPDISMLDAVNRDAASLTVRWQPGTRHAYSNPGYGILGHLIEKFSGQRFEQYIATQILTPLGMDNCKLSSAITAEAGLSAGFVDAEPVPFRQIYLRSAGSLHCTAPGLAKLGQWLLSRGQQPTLPALDRNTIALMETPQSSLAASKGLEFGYGKGIYHATRAGREWLGHNGGIDGFITSYGYSHKFNRGYALMLNSSSVNLKPLLETITNYLAADNRAAKANYVALDMPQLNGYYRLNNDRNQIFAGISFSTAVAKLSLTGDTLLVDPLLGEAEEYRHLGNGQFAEAGQNHAKAVVIGQTAEGFAIDLSGDYLLKTSALSAWLPIIVLGFISLVFLLTLCYAPVWIVNALRGKFNQRQQLWLRLMPLMNVACLAAVIFALFNLSLFESGQVNWQTLTIYLGTVAFAVSSIATTWLALRLHKNERSHFARYFAITCAVSANLFALYCYQFDYLGLALWQW